jgi:hypothetical protein
VRALILLGLVGLAAGRRRGARGVDPAMDRRPRHDAGVVEFYDQWFESGLPAMVTGSITGCRPDKWVAARKARAVWSLTCAFTCNAPGPQAPATQRYPSGGVCSRLHPDAAAELADRPWPRRESRKGAFSCEFVQERRRTSPASRGGRRRRRGNCRRCRSGRSRRRGASRPRDVRQLPGMVVRAARVPTPWARRTPRCPGPPMRGPGHHHSH